MNRTIHEMSLLAALVWACCAFVSPAAGIDLTGAWASDPGACDKVFARKGNTLSLRRDSEMHGSGFILEGRRIRGRTASCTISRSNEADGVVHMIASCATDIMLSNVQFSLKPVDRDKVSRIFPGVDGMELTYYRCPQR